MTPLQAPKADQLKSIIKDWPSAFVAYSGGVDSAFLLFTAYQVLGARVTGVLGDSPSLPRSEYQAAIAFAEKHHLPLEVLSTQEMADPAYIANPPNRCFFCRAELFQRMSDLAASRGVSVLAYGENADDALEVRAGRGAAGKFSVLSPLRDAGLTKMEIRQLAHASGLDVAEKPAAPCLSSRLAPGLAVSLERLASIEKAETAVRARGFTVVRVRHYGSKALLQVAPREVSRLNEPSLRNDLVREILQAGFAEVEFDQVGYQGAGLR